MRRWAVALAFGHERQVGLRHYPIHLVCELPAARALRRCSQSKAALLLVVSVKQVCAMHMLARFIQTLHKRLRCKQEMAWMMDMRESLSGRFFWFEICLLVSLGRSLPCFPGARRAHTSLSVAARPGSRCAIASGWLDEVGAPSHVAEPRLFWKRVHRRCV